MARIEKMIRAYTFVALLLVSLTSMFWLGMAPSQGAARPTQEAPTLSDTGILTEWALPPNRGPWQLKWNSSRSLIWFAEGTHSNPPLDQVGALDPDTGVLREWGIPTTGGYVHGTAIDRSFDIWFTEVRQNKIGRLQPDSNTITEWALDPTGFPHGIAVDDIITSSVRVWFSERDSDNISSLDLATGVYLRHPHPFSGSWPHSVVVASDHSVWFVETCGNRVGQLVSSGGTDTWKFWQPPTAGGLCSPPNNIGPLFGNFVNGDFWYSEPYNGRVIRLQPSENKFTMWSVPGASGGTKLITQPVGDENGMIYFPEMSGNRIGRLEPVGATTPTVVVVVPTTVSQPMPAEATALPVSVVYTPIVTQLTPVPRTLTGTRNGSIVEWTLPTIPPTPGRRIGPGRAWYGGGAMWIAELTVSKIGRFVPYTSTPGATATTVAATASATFTPIGTATSTSTATTTPGGNSATPTTTGTAGPTNTGTVTQTATGVATGTATPTSSATPPTLDLRAAWYAYSPTCNQPAFVLSVYVEPQDATVPVTTTMNFNGTDFVVPPFTGYYTTECSTGPCTPGYVIYTLVADSQNDVQETNEENNVDTHWHLFGLPCTPTAMTTATSTPIPATATSTACAITFSDVPSDHTFYANIRCLACRGIISGYSDGTFKPGNEITRSQIAKMVSNAAGFNEDPGPQIFEDVDPAHTFYSWINRLSMRGHMGGYPCGTIPEEPCEPPDNRPYFRPFANATRGQLAKIVANAAGVGGTPTGLYFTDVPEDNPFYTWIMRLTNLGVMGGYPCGGEGEPCDDANRPYFRPFANVTRGQASKIVANTFYPNCETPLVAASWHMKQSGARLFYCEIGEYLEEQK